MSSCFNYWCSVVGKQECDIYRTKMTINFSIEMLSHLFLEFPIKVPKRYILSIQIFTDYHADSSVANLIMCKEQIDI